MSREYTEEEVRELFLVTIRNIAKYWSELPDKECYIGTDQASINKWRTDGVAFSILAALDGCTLNIPGFIVAPCPHNEDKQYNMDNDDNYYPENRESPINCDIAGCLHELFHKKED